LVNVPALLYQILADETAPLLRYPKAATYSPLLEMATPNLGHPEDEKLLGTVFAVNVEPDLAKNLTELLLLFWAPTAK
jgi:hypothetical protein